MNAGFHDKHVIVTGASGGIGLETISRFLQEGAKVTACYRRDSKKFATLAETYPDKLHVIKVDVRHEAEVGSLFMEANTVFGRVDATVANAGIAAHEGVAVHAMSLERWQKTLAVNLTGGFLCAKYFFDNLKKYFINRTLPLPEKSQKIVNLNQSILQELVHRRGWVSGNDAARHDGGRPRRRRWPLPGGPEATGPRGAGKPRDHEADSE